MPLYDIIRGIAFPDPAGEPGQEIQHATGEVGVDLEVEGAAPAWIEEWIAIGAIVEVPAVATQPATVATKKAEG